MNDIVPVQKSRKLGRPADYDADVHIDLLYDTFDSGGGIVKFCAEANICVKTFHNWKKKHKEFRDAYNLCLPKGAARSEDHAILQGKDLNFQAWSFIHKNRFGQLYKKLPRSKDKSTNGKCNSAYKALELGYITAQEYNQIMSGVTSELKIKELELRNKELELKAKELEQQRHPQIDVRAITDEQIKIYMAFMAGKKVVVVEDNK